ncbi:MAG: ABC transporter permease [Bacteroidetes bacterium]|nr:ABC transporter permease [Bacteroidota bacterium]
MKVRRSLAILLRYGYLLRGSTTRVVPLFAWSVIDIVLWGFITKYFGTFVSGEVRLVPMLLGAVLFWDFFTRIMQGLTTTFLEDVWSRNFLNLFASPISVSEYLGGLILTTLLTSTVGLIAMILFATLGFGLPMLVYGSMLIPFILILVLFGISFGLFACALVLRLGPASEWFVWPIPAILAPFAGVFYPTATLPVWMQWFSRLLPASYIFDGMREVVRHGSMDPASLILPFTIATGYIALAWYTFSRVFRLAVRTGLIARYSAESVS